MKINLLPDAAVLWDRFDYKPLSGELVSKRKAKIKGKQNRRYICQSVVIEGKTHQMKTHRAVWKWCTGQDPSSTIDHINRDTHDNRIWNLREATDAEQQRNRTNNVLDIASVKLIRQKLANGERVMQIAKDVGVHYSLVSYVRSGKIWAGV